MPAPLREHQASATSKYRARSNKLARSVLTQSLASTRSGPDQPAEIRTRSQQIYRDGPAIRLSTRTPDSYKPQMTSCRYEPCTPSTSQAAHQDLHPTPRATRGTQSLLVPDCLS